MKLLSVLALTNQLKELVETTFMQVSVEGELSRITYHNSGHVYFSLKEKSALIKAVMFRSNAARLAFRLEEGMKVVLHGAITVYVPRGEYQINVSSVEEAGDGALAVAFEQLKRELQAQGLFDASRKKPIPRFLHHIALVTSQTGAALQDMLRVGKQRWPLAQVTLYDTKVQGDGASASIITALKRADANGHDAIVLSRGGGSMEDLNAFNDKALALYISSMNSVVISAVGHEIDWVITDYVADLRAPTPSAAMQMILPDQHEMLMNIDALIEQFYEHFKRQVHHKKVQLNALKELFEQHAISKRIALQHEQIRSLHRQFEQQLTFIFRRNKEGLLQHQQQMSQQMATVLRHKKEELLALSQQLSRLEPSKRINDGFVQLSRNKKLLTLSALKQGDEVTLQDATYEAAVQVLDVKPFK